jgi:peptide/nickel transport system substrate-binding protein
MSKQNGQQTYSIEVERALMSRRRFLQGTAGIASLFTFAQLAAACGAPAAPATTTPAAETGVAAATGPKQGGRIIFAAESIGESLEPGLWNGFGIINIVDNLAAYLTRPNSSGVWTDPAEGFIAESWTISDDGRTYAFKIRPGMTFHDGTPVDANAVVRSLTRQVNPDDPSYVEGLYMHTNYTSNRKSITAPDDMTVVIELEAPDAAYLYRLFHPSAVILSPKSLDELKQGIATNLVSAGPFKLVKFTPGVEAQLVAFEDYYLGRPYLDEIVIRGYPDEGAMLSAIEAGEVNFAPYPPSSAIPRLQNDPTKKVVVGDPVVSLFLAANVNNAPLDNKDVRKAINYAINRENLIQAVLYGLGEPPATMIGPTELGFDPSGREISKQDIAKAQEHIAASGLATPIPITLTYESNRFWPQMAELIKSDLEAVGFAVTLDPQDAGSYWGKVLDGKAQLSMNQRSLWVPDPDNKVVLLQSGEASAKGETGIVTGLPEFSAKMDELLAAGKSELDPEKRKAIYKEIQEMILEELPYIMLAYYTKPTVMAANVEGLKPGAAATERIFLEDVWLN